MIASARVDDTYSVFYNGGTAGQVSGGEVRKQTGYVFAMLERYSTQYSEAPPAGTIDPGHPQFARGSESRGGRSGWWGVEPGNLRIGVAYVGNWGWIEGDLVLR